MYNTEVTVFSWGTEGVQGYKSNPSVSEMGFSAFLRPQGRRVSSGRSHTPGDGKVTERDPCVELS